MRQATQHTILWVMHLSLSLFHWRKDTDVEYKVRSRHCSIARGNPIKIILSLLGVVRNCPSPKVISPRFNEYSETVAHSAATSLRTSRYIRPIIIFTSSCLKSMSLGNARGCCTLFFVIIIFFRIPLKNNSRGSEKKLLGGMKVVEITFSNK